MVQDKSKLNQVLNSTKVKLDEIHLEDTKVYKLGEQLKVIVRMLKSYVTGRYQEVPWKTIVMLVAGIIYFLMPIDLIPDFIPVTGFIDDFTIIMLISGAFQQDIQDYLQWEETNK